MPHEERKRVARALGFVLASLPLCFGALRALTSGTDVRYILTALSSLIAAGATFRFSAGRVRSGWVRSLLALAFSTLVGAIAAFGQGATSAAAVGVVAGAFGACVTLGGMLGVFSRRAV
jgi:hypothetical protein